METAGTKATHDRIGEAESESMKGKPSAALCYEESRRRPSMTRPDGGGERASRSGSTVSSSATTHDDILRSSLPTYTIPLAVPRQA